MIGEAPYTLHVHLVTGEVLTQTAVKVHITPPGFDEDGISTPMRFSYDPWDWRDTIGYIDYTAVIAIRIERTDEQARIDEQAFDEHLAEMMTDQTTSQS